MDALIDTKAAAALIAQGALVLDATWTMPNSPQTGRALYLRRHVAGAQFFDVDAVADKSTDLPHMLPDARQLAEALQNFGHAEGQPIVIYDQNSFFASARVWWMLEGFGVPDTFVLDGGIDSWIREGGALSSRDETRVSSQDESSNFKRQLRLAAGVAGLDTVRANLASREYFVADARSLERFSGREPEPRPHLASGHIPGSVCVPWRTVLTEEGKMRTGKEIQTLFASAGIDRSKPVIFTCGSGISAAVLFLAARVAGYPDIHLYDGSWAQWGSLADSPIARSPPASR